MMMRFFSFRTLWRINAIIIFVLGLLAIAAFLFSLSPMLRSYQGGDVFRESDVPAELERSKFTGSKLGSVVAYTAAGSDYDFPDEGRNNVTFVNLKNGRTMSIIPDGSDEKIIIWNMLQMTVDGEDQGLGYIAMKAVDPDFSAGSGKIEIGRFENMKRITIASGIQAMDGAQAINEREISVILWPEKNRANLVIVDLEKMKVTKEIPIDLAGQSDDVR